MNFKSHKIFVVLIFAVILSVNTLVFAQEPDSTKLVSVIVKLQDDSLSAYRGGINGLAPTSPDVTGASRVDVKSGNSKAYLNYLIEKHKIFETNALKAIPNSKTIHRYKVVFGGVSMLVPEDKVYQLSKMPGVKAVYRDRLNKADTERSPFFILADKMWDSLGGVENAGEGIIVGVIDTGIWPEHPSFANPDPFGKLYPPPPPGWGGFCEPPLDSSPPITCNNKLIGAREFLNTYKFYEGPLPPGEFDSARDSDGHGTHTASTAAGNANVPASILGAYLGNVYGIAPRSYVAMYKALGPNGGYDSDLVAAIEQAVADGVDVINYSIGPTNAFEVDPYTNPDDLAFLDAYRAGIFVATSAGNSGPGPDTVNHLGGWTTTVAASTSNRHFISTIFLTADGGATLTLTGASVTGGISTATSVVLASNYGDELCLNPFPAGTFNGKIVICKRGTIARVAKSYNVRAGGAGGMFLYNPTLQGLSTDNHFIPSVHLENDAGALLLSFLASHTGVKSTFTQGTATNVQGDVTASFSSRGGPEQTYGISKPDVTAPGVQILAGHTPQPMVTGSSPGEYFQAIEGTSMSSPHVAGAAALLKERRPYWRPGQIKSALMTTAKTQRVFKEDGITPADPFDIGSGRINLAKAGRPGLTFNVSGQHFIDHKDDLWNVNYPSIYIPSMPDTITIRRRVHSELSLTALWLLSVTTPPDLIITTPGSLSVPAGGNVIFNITIDASSVPAGQVRHATLIMRYSNYILHVPITIVRSSFP